MYTVTLVLLYGLIVGPPAPVAVHVTRFDDPVPDGCARFDCSLREAVILVNADHSVGGILLDPGTYSLSLPDTGPNTAADGDLDLLDAIVIEGAGVGATIIDGGGISGIFHIPSPSYAVEIRGVTLQNGESLDGGAVLNAGDLVLSDCEITSNHALNGGGGVSNLAGATLTITNCLLTDNEASNSAGGGAGGALENAGTATVSDSLLDGNSAADVGGAIAIGDVSPPAQTLIDNSTISNNTAGTTAQWYGGGGIINFGELTVQASAIVGNAAANSDGGGLNNWSLATLINVTLSGNTAASEGGAVRNTGGTTIFVSSTIVNNSAPDTGGVWGTALAPPLFQISIVANNTGGNCNMPFGEDSCAYPNLDSEDSCDFCPALVNTDPLLGPLAVNSRGTPTHALLAGSPAIDGANPASSGHGCPFLGSPLVALASDQRGWPRPIDGDDDGAALCDLGAFELAGEIFVDGFESGDLSAWSPTLP